ncbi:MAG: transglutaminase-like domain-containing protein [Acidobacteriota bacterium]|nr:transglutaminase-like domain-containing protein [Acidobacteriota bacterium]
MRKLTSVVVFCFFAGPFVAGGERTLYQPGDARKLVWDIYTSLYASQKLEIPQRRNLEVITRVNWKSRSEMVNTLLFLNERDSATPMRAVDVQTLVNRREIPHYDEARIASHVRTLYQARNKEMVQAILAGGETDTLTLVTFLGMADRMDGKLDVNLGMPNLDQLFDLVVHQKIPVAAIGFNFREGGAWADRREVITFDKLERELPKSLLKLRRSKMSDGKKMQRIMKWINKIVVASIDTYGTDYWQTPIETILVGEGDCEDFAILFHTVADYLGVETKIVIGFTRFTRSNGEKVRDGHAWIEYKGMVFDPINPDNERYHYQPLVRFNAIDAEFAVPNELPQQRLGDRLASM